MLLTLNTSSIRALLKPRRAKPKVAMTDLPVFARDHMGLSGLCLTADLLAGMTRAGLEALRDRGDKAGCVCLTLVEPASLKLADTNAGKADAASDRAGRLLQAGRLLGCSAVGVSIAGKADDPHFERAVEQLKAAEELAERAEMNLLIRPGPGLTSDPDRVTELIKRVGGFRIGSMPSFAEAVENDDPAAYLRRLTPYATVVQASTSVFTEPEPVEGDDGIDPDDEALTLEDLVAALDPEASEPLLPPVHTPYDLNPLVAAVAAVGFDGSLAIDYRGDGDGTLGVNQSREALEAALEAAGG